MEIQTFSCLFHADISINGRDIDIFVKIKIVKFYTRINGKRLKIL